MDKVFIIERLELLVSLIEKTEPKNISDKMKNLFSRHAMTTMEMLEKVRTGNIEREELISMMKCANRIWRIRNKVKNGEWDDLSHIEMNDTIEDYIAQNQKINAIKYYRQEMSDQFSEQVTLREAKEHIDKIADDMRLRGIL